MPIKNNYVPELNLIESIFEGKISYNNIKDAVVEATKMAIKQKTRLFLSDCTELTRGSSIVELYAIAEFFDVIHVDHSIKQAVILPDNQEVKAALRFYETTTHNRGYNVLVFADKQKAINWLLNK
jgi:hypothetical protein